MYIEAQATYKHLSQDYHLTLGVRCPEYLKILFLDIRVVTKLALWGTGSRLSPHIHSGYPYE